MSECSQSVGPLRVEEPLVGGAALVDLAATLDLAAHHPVVAAVVGLLAHDSHSLRIRSQRSMCSVGTCSSCLWANIGSPGPKLTAGTPSLVNWATSVQPNFGSTSPPTTSTNSFAAGSVEARHRAGGRVGHGDVVALEEVADERLGVGLVAVGGEAEVDLDHAFVGDHVARHPAAYAGRVEALVIGQAVDDGLVGGVVVEPREHRCGEVDRVDALPAPGAVGALAGGAYVDAHGALAAGLDRGVARLHQDREVGLHEVGVAHGELAQAVVDRVDLLGLVEDEGEVAVGLCDVCGELEHHRVAALHVAAAEAVEDAVLEPRRQVVVERDRVEVAGDHHALAASEVGARNHGVAAAGDRQVRQREERGLDRVGDLLLVVGHGLDVDELLGEGDDVGGQVEIHARHLVSVPVPRGGRPARR